MADPLSISASIIGVLGAVKSLYDFLDKYKDADKTFEAAGNDLKNTESVLQSLRQYLESPRGSLPAVQALINERSALGSVLKQYKQTCDGFRTTLEKCIRHPGADSGLSWTDRLRLVKQERKISTFQSEVSKARELIGLRVNVISLLVSDQTTAQIDEFQQKNGATMDTIVQQLSGLEMVITNLAEPSEAMEKALDNQATELNQQLLLCEENLQAAKTQECIKQEFGNTHIGHRSQTFMGLDSSGKTRFAQKYGNTEVGNGSVIFMGASSEGMMRTFFHGPESAREPAGAAIAGPPMNCRLEGVSSGESGDDSVDESLLLLNVSPSSLRRVIPSRS